MTDERRCEFTWINRHGEKRRCMLDKAGHNNFNHLHGIESHPVNKGKN